MAALTGTIFAAGAPEISDDALRGYQTTMHKMTEKPRPVDVAFSILCRPNPASKAAQKRDGLHYGTWMNVYMNGKAQTNFEAKTNIPFPPGSIVLKEKLASGLSNELATKDSVPTVLAVAGLIKHEPGYDAQTGDWEFFYYEKDGRIERGAQGKMAACADCHRGSATDYVFGDFAKPVARH